MSSGHMKRVLTSAVALPVLALVILKGGRTGFTLLVALTAAVGLLEYHALFLHEGHWRNVWYIGSGLLGVCFRVPRPVEAWGFDGRRLV